MAIDLRPELDEVEAHLDKRIKGIRDLFWRVEIRYEPASDHIKLCAGNGFVNAMHYVSRAGLYMVGAERLARAFEDILGLMAGNLCLACEKSNETVAVTIVGADPDRIPICLDCALATVDLWRFCEFQTHEQSVRLDDWQGKSGKIAEIAGAASHPMCHKCGEQVDPGRCWCGGSFPHYSSRETMCRRFWQRGCACWPAGQTSVWWALVGKRYPDNYAGHHPDEVLPEAWPPPSGAPGARLGRPDFGFYAWASEPVRRLLGVERKRLRLVASHSESALNWEFERRKGNVREPEPPRFPLLIDGGEFPPPPGDR